MVAIPSRRKSLVLLAGIIVLQVLLLAVQIKRQSQGRLIRVWTVGAASPFERAGSYGFGWIRDTWRHYFALQNTTKGSGTREPDDSTGPRVTRWHPEKYGSDHSGWRGRQSRRSLSECVAGASS